MHRICLIAVLLVAACAETPPPVSGPSVVLPPPVPRSAPGQQPAAQRAAQPSGEPSQSPFDVGGAGQGPVMPSQVSPAFRGM